LLPPQKENLPWSEAGNQVFHSLKPESLLFLPFSPFYKSPVSSSDPATGSSPSAEEKREVENTPFPFLADSPGDFSSHEP
jgi:hypothetical protein